MVDPEFADRLLTELIDNRQYSVGDALTGTEAGVHHNEHIMRYLGSLPLLAEYRKKLNDTITEVSGFYYEHLTYLTVRVCPNQRKMSTRIHRNDKRGGPWLVTLTVAGSGSVNIYPDELLRYEGHEIDLDSTEGKSAEPMATSPMQTGDAWGAYSMNWSAPHAGGPNTSGQNPKVLVLLYGWEDRMAYEQHAAAQISTDPQRRWREIKNLPPGIFTVKQG